MKLRRFDVAIIGGGASGMATLAALAALAQQQKPLGARPISVAVIDRDSRIGYGCTYGPDSHWLLMNTPAHLLSIRSDDTEHFIHWLQRQGDTSAAAGPYSYVSRMTYGEYLREQFQHIKAKSRDLDVCQIIAWAQRLDLDTDGGVRIGLDTAPDLIARKVVLATGPNAPSDPYGLTGRPGYLANPYPAANRLTGVPPEQDVTIIGSSLTAVDVVLSLVHLGHRGNITMASRRGLLPEVRPDYTVIPYADTATAPCQHDQISPADALQAFREFFATTINTQQPYPGFAREMSTNPVENFFEAVRLSGNPAAPGCRDRCLRFNELNKVYLVMQQVWPYLNEAELMAFMDTQYATWQRLLTPIPRTNAEQILRLINAGVLDVRGGLRAVLPTRHEAFELSFSDESSYTAKVVINATGPRRNLVAAGEDHLYAHLKRNGDLRELPTGGARVTHPDGNLIGVAGPVEQIHAVGQPSLGSHPCINDLIQIAANAGLIARAICDQLRRHHLSSTAPEKVAW